MAKRHRLGVLDEREMHGFVPEGRRRAGPRRGRILHHRHDRGDRAPPRAPRAHASLFAVRHPGGGEGVRATENPAGMATRGYKSADARRPYDANRAVRRMGVYVEGVRRGDGGRGDAAPGRAARAGHGHGRDAEPTRATGRVPAEAELSNGGGLLRMHRERQIRADAFENRRNVRGSRWRVVKACATRPESRAGSGRTKHHLRHASGGWIKLTGGRNDVVNVAFASEACSFRRRRAVFRHGRVRRTSRRCSPANGVRKMAHALSDDGRYYAVDSRGREAWNADDSKGDDSGSDRFARWQQRENRAWPPARTDRGSFCSEASGSASAPDHGGHRARTARARGGFFGRGQHVLRAHARRGGGLRVAARAPPRAARPADTC